MRAVHATVGTYFPKNAFKLPLFQMPTKPLPTQPTLPDYVQVPHYFPNQRHKHEEAHACTQLLWLLFMCCSHTHISHCFASQCRRCIFFAVSGDPGMKSKWLHIP